MIYIYDIYIYDIYIYMIYIYIYMTYTIYIYIYIYIIYIYIYMYIMFGLTACGKALRQSSQSGLTTTSTTCLSEFHLKQTNDMLQTHNN